MLKPRIIPCLLIHENGLTKTVRFNDGKYVGDPLNAVKIFNEKEVDELMVIDIDATIENRGPNFERIKNLAYECRMPLCYGGGVSSVADAVKIISLGAEKVAISSKAIASEKLVTEIANAVGRQSVVVVLDVKKVGIFGKYEVFTHRGKKPTKLNPVELALKMEKAGAGELVINSIDRDGTMEGYDLKLLQLIREKTTIPITALGGAGSLGDLKELIKNFKIIGAAAGSLFVFKGKYKAVLINYPKYSEKLDLFQQST